MLQTTEILGSKQRFRRFNSGLLVTVGLASVFITGAIGFYLLRQNNPAATEAQMSSEQPTKLRTVMALGRLEPEGEMIAVAAATSPNGSDKVAQLLVEEGSLVKAGQVIAILDSYDRLQATLAESRQQVGIATARLTQVKVGKSRREVSARKAQTANLQAELAGSVTTQRSALVRLEAELQNVQADYRVGQASLEC
jgi:HlyD family secretion protein